MQSNRRNTYTMVLGDLVTARLALMGAFIRLLNN